MEYLKQYLVAWVSVTLSRIEFGCSKDCSVFITMSTPMFKSPFGRPWMANTGGAASASGGGDGNKSMKGIIAGKNNKLGCPES